ncbi:hypothetical protein SK128_013226 [Halocaridina rubra]|uniref:MRH domain-containing protein n=1 Tax=Halocaridina rubra TaxID=373956 RepID=A0AAN8ZY58_HALRR
MDEMTSAEQLKDVNGNIYDFVLCGQVAENLKNVSISQTVPKSSSPLKILGYNNQTVLSGQGSWIMLTFNGGDKYEKSCNGTNRQAHVLFVCDPFQKELEIHTVDGNLTEDTCYLLFLVRHEIVCQNAREAGLSGGTVFLILLLVTFGAYFMFGFFYLRLVKGAKGVEQIPNREFWFKIGNILAFQKRRIGGVCVDIYPCGRPGLFAGPQVELFGSVKIRVNISALLRDGCAAVCRCDNYCGGRGGISSASSYSGYSPIEEQMARDLQETDRDTALLRP